MPSLLKRFSFKNLNNRRSASVNEEPAAEIGRQPTQPPISNAQRAFTLPAGLKEQSSSASLGQSTSNEGLPSPSPGANGEPPVRHVNSSSPALRNKPVPPLPTPPLSSSSTLLFHESPRSIEFDPIQNLAHIGIVDKLNAGPKSTEVEKVLNKIDDAVATAQGQEATASAVIAPVKGLLNATGAMESIQQGLHSFMEDIPWLMRGLDEVARIHPFVTVAVLAFKTVYNMELTRRENDKRIIALYVEMKDMMAVLIQLRDVKDEDEQGPGGMTVRARLQDTIAKVADDIQHCANTCDTYSKKRLLVKVLKGSYWELKLAGFVETFTRRRTELQQALTIHMARGVDAIQSDIQGVRAIAEATFAKLNTFKELFNLLEPPDLIRMRDRVKERGDISTLYTDDNALKELNDFENTLDGPSKTERSKKRSQFSVKDLKEELREDLDSAISKNLETFEGKFRLYQRQLNEELKKSINEANNLVLRAVREGPYEKIKNKELRDIWKEMNWRRNVKARLFVMTLRDHFREKVRDIKPEASNADPAESHTDDWALQYVGPTWLQPIMEAFDDDGSGYVTIAEINEFTDGLPSELSWSLQHWIAYWAIGWQITAAGYKKRIDKVFGQMFALRSTILPQNRYWVDYYLDKVWSNIVPLTLALNLVETSDWEKLEVKFKPYVDHEEDRIKRNLEDIRFDIDALDTVYVVAGPGRIEKHLLPLIYLLLERDLKKFRSAQKHVLHSDELWDAADSLLWVHDAAVGRYQDLNELYKQQREDVAAQFKTLACGLFSYFHDLTELWSISNLHGNRFQYFVSKEDLDNQETTKEDTKSHLNYALPEATPFITSVYEQADTMERSSNSQCLPDPLPEILGRWSGFAYTKEEYPILVMWSWYNHADPGNENGFKSSGIDFMGEPYSVKGTCRRSEDGTISVSFAIIYTSGDPTEYFNGHLCASGSLTGYKGTDENVSEEDHVSLFIFRKVSPEIMAYRPSPMEIAANKPRALLRFALDYTLTQVRKRQWSWSYFRERRTIRQRYIQLNIRKWTYGPPLDDQEGKEFLFRRRSLIPADATLYRSLRDYLIDSMPFHGNCTCDACHEPIGGARLICLDCFQVSLFRTMDFCDYPTCRDAEVTSATRNDLEPNKPHISNHDFLKLRTAATVKDLPELYQSAQAALEQCRSRFGLHDDVQPDGEAAESQMSKQAIQCSVCSLIVSSPCWYCVTCSDLFICDDCESQTRLKCTHCQSMYTQPTWYYGSSSDDAFLCNKCLVRKVDSAGTPLRGIQHTYTHPLVRCKERVEKQVDPSKTTEERIATLEQRISEVDGKLDRIQSSFDERFGKTSETLESVHQSLNLIVRRLDALERRLPSQ